MSPMIGTPTSKTVRLNLVKIISRFSRLWDSFSFFQILIFAAPPCHQISSWGLANLFSQILVSFVNKGAFHVFRIRCKGLHRFWQWLRFNFSTRPGWFLHLPISSSSIVQTLWLWQKSHPRHVLCKVVLTSRSAKPNLLQHVLLHQRFHLYQAEFQVVPPNVSETQTWSDSPEEGKFSAPWRPWMSISQLFHFLEIRNGTRISNTNSVGFCSFMIYNFLNTGTGNMSSTH